MDKAEQYKIRTSVTAVVKGRRTWDRYYKFMVRSCQDPGERSIPSQGKTAGSSPTDPPPLGKDLLVGDQPRMLAHGAPDAAWGGGHRQIGDAERGQRVEDRVHHGRR